MYIRLRRVNIGQNSSIPSQISGSKHKVRELEKVWTRTPFSHNLPPYKKCPKLYGIRSKQVYSLGNSDRRCYKSEIRCSKSGLTVLRVALEGLVR